ncbi:hypothetical protein niasHS_015834 [Heterodera schachtii]|uniref:Uncharacterized protein n=1 Tax=Heterodera schachtii TaxID=97005 RepID=A0ABD2HTG6_HETSC
MGKMKDEKNWNYADLNQKKMLEWKLMEIELINDDQRIEKWGAIQSARNEWKELFDCTVFSENGREKAKLEKKMEELMEELKHLQIEEENGENKNKEKVEEKEGK